MTTKELSERLFESEPFQQVKDKLERGESASLRGVPGAMGVFLAALPVMKLAKTVVVVHPDGDRAEDITEDLEQLLG